ncbi:MAG: hypothetical protein QM817_10345 [Archangium sp.]
MTVPVNTARVSYPGNGIATVFSTQFYFLDPSDVLVVLKPSGGSDIVQTLGVDYTLSIPGRGTGAAGNVTMLAAPGVGATLFIQRNTPFTQTTSFRNAGTFDRATHEDTYDRLEFQIQELDTRLGDVESAGAPGAVTAGNGLTSTGTAPMALHVGPGAGIAVAADTVSVDFGLTSDLAPASADVADAGAIAKAARINHKHTVLTAAPSTLLAGSAGTGGASISLSRADHVHPMPIGSATQLSTAASSPGSTGAFSDAGHVHDIKTGNGAEITDSGFVAGSGPGFAAEGHSHPHGNRGGGALHALATNAANGFQSAADKAISETITETSLTTADATVTTIATLTPTNTKAETVIATVTAKDKATSNSASYRAVACVKRQGGTTTLTGTVNMQWTIEDVAGWDCTIDVSTPDVRVRVTGAAATNIDWKCRLERVKSP